MTDDSYELVSAYLDGQATDDEVARIEADPTLLREVAEMRAVSAELAEMEAAPDSERRATQIAAALDLFDTLSSPAKGAGSLLPGDDQTATVPVVDIGQARTKRADKQQRAPEPGSSGFPTWLSAAAGLLIIAGGIGWIATQGMGGDDDAETASVAADTDDREASEEAGDEATGFDQAIEAAPASEAEARVPTTTTMPLLTAPEDAAGAATEADDADEEQGEAAQAADESASTGSGSGLFPEEELERGRVFYDAPPSSGELVELTEGELFPIEFSACGADVAGPDPSTLIGFVPVSVAGVSGEAFVFDSDLEGLVTVVVDPDCRPLG